MKRTLASGLAGAAGGALGTAFMQGAMAVDRRLPERMRSPALNADPGDFMTTQAERALGRQLPQSVHHRLANALHWAYGIAWPTALSAALGDSIGQNARRALTAGAGLGAAVWALGYLGWLPATRLIQRGTGRKLPRQANALLGHVAYGVITLLPLYLYRRLSGTRRRRLWDGLRRRASIA